MVGLVSRTSKKSFSACDWKNRLEMKLANCSSRPISINENPTKLTMPPTEILPWTCSAVPSAKIATTVSVLAARVNTDRVAQPLSTGYCAASARAIISRRPRDSSWVRVKLCTTATLPSTSSARVEMSW